jgi:hypothetical protein
MSKYKGTVPQRYLILPPLVSLLLSEPDLTVAGDYSDFVRAWEKPGDGLRGFLLRFLASRDEIDQHIAVWTLTQLLESDGSPPFHEQRLIF